MSTDVDLVIVGAGAAGLGAAKEAQKLGLTFALLEASHRIGGRAYTEAFAPGVPYDLGCHWLHSASLNPFVAIAEREGFHFEKDNDWHSSIFERGSWLSDEKMTEMNEAEEALELAIKAAVDDGKDVTIADVMDLTGPWAHYFAYWSSLGTSHDIDQVSIIDYVAYNDTDEDWPLREGFGALVARWSADVPVTLNAPVSRVTWDAKGVTVESAKGTVRARRVLVTVSTNVLASGTIAFSPSLPDWKHDAIAALPLGVHNRIGIMLNDNPFGSDIKDNATIFLDGDDVPMSFEIRPFGHPYVSGVTGGRFGSWLERAGQKASVDYVSERLTRTFGSAITKSLSDRVIVTAWEGDPWTLGSYSGATPGNGHMRAELAKPVDDTVFFAGEATHTSFFATCHGAYLSGIDQVQAIAKG